MRRDELVGRVAASAGCEWGIAAAVVDALVEVVVDRTAREGLVVLRGLGAFRVVSRLARTARNPRTGGVVEVPARNVVRFRPAKAFRTVVEERG